MCAIDALPPLLETDGGPFQVIQPRWNRTFATRKRTLVVLRQASPSFRLDRFSSQQTISVTNFALRAWWAVSSGTGKVEDDQLAFEQAIDMVITRVAGPLEDKTHGGRFLSVAEDRQGITVHFDDPEQSVPTGFFRAQITYNADDPEITN